MQELLEPFWYRQTTWRRKAQLCPRCFQEHREKKREVVESVSRICFSSFPFFLSTYKQNHRPTSPCLAWLCSCSSFRKRFLASMSAMHPLLNCRWVQGTNPPNWKGSFCCFALNFLFLVHRIPELGWLRQENQKLEAKLIYIAVLILCPMLWDPVSKEKINSSCFSSNFVILVGLFPTVIVVISSQGITAWTSPQLAIPVILENPCATSNLRIWGLVLWCVSHGYGLKGYDIWEQERWLSG